MSGVAQYGAVDNAALLQGIQASMIPLMLRSITAIIFGGILLTGCNLSSAADAYDAARENAGRVRLSASTSVARAEDSTVTPMPVAATATPIAPEPTPNRCAADEDQPTRRIQADVRIDYATKTTEIVERIEFVNREDAALDEIILDVQANQWEDSFWLEDLTVSGDAADYELQQNRLAIHLKEALATGCWLEIGLTFRLQPAEIRDGLRSYRGFLGYSSRQLNLGHFLPTVAARVAGQWRIHEPSGIGEQVVYEVADWQVNVTVNNAAPSLVLAAPGTVDSLVNQSWRISLPGSRDFAMSLSEEFVVREQQINDQLSLAVYTFADARINAGGQWLDAAEHALQEAVKALDLFGQRFGEYGRARFVIVQGDFPDGMEFSGLVFVGGAWFYQFDGTPKNYLTLIAVHEIAHQWWYARVGNDAALNPWLDEALATYSEYLFIESHYPAERNWWWSFRVAGYFPRGKVDSTVYEFQTPREYINAVYLRGVQMLQNLREDIGDDAFFDLLRAYSAAGAGLVADPKLFWRHLSEAQRPLSLDTRNEFLRDPDVNALLGDTEPGDPPNETGAEGKETP